MRSLVCAFVVSSALLTPAVTLGADLVVGVGGSTTVFKDNYIDQRQTIKNYQTVYKGVDAAEVKRVVEAALNPLQGPIQQNDAQLAQATYQIGRQLKALQELNSGVKALRDEQAELHRTLDGLSKSQQVQREEIQQALARTRQQLDASVRGVRELILADQIAEANERMSATNRALADIQRLREQIDEQRRSQKWRRLGTAMSGGVAGVGVVVGVIFLVQAQSNWKDAKVACPDRAGCPDDRGNDLSRRASEQATVATVAFGVAGAAFATGAALLLWPTSDDEESGRRLSMSIGLTGSSGSCALVGSF